MNCLGVVQVPLSRLYYLEDVGGRYYYEEHSDHLEGLFRGTSIDHSNQRHWVDGYVDDSEISSVVRDVGLSLMELQRRNLKLEFPHLTNRSVAYSHGRHRIEAAKKVNDDLLWTIRLFSTDMSNIRSNQLVRRRTEQFQHRRPYSDGQIYSKLREYNGSDIDYCEWYQRLGPSKKKALRYIERRLVIAGALDALIPFPGIMESLQLGSWTKYFNWRLDDELYFGLRQVYEAWSKFSFGSHSVQKCLDKEAVEMLEGRVPGVSRSDWRWIDSVFNTGKVFRGVTDQEKRRDIRERVISWPNLIPGMKSLQSNMLYLGIAADIVWSYLIPEELRKKAKADQMSLRSTMRSFWSGTVGYVEVKEGEFRQVVGPPSFDLAYLMVMLAALRQFACLSASKPKSDTGELFTDPNCISLFRRRANLVGFRTRNIDHSAEIQASPFDPCSGDSALKAAISDEVCLFERIDYRYGRPHISLFRLIQERAFLPCLIPHASPPEIGVSFLLGEFIRCFFRPCPFEYDLSQPVININRPPFISLGYTATAQNSYRSWPNDNRLETITEEEHPGVLSSRMDVDSQTDNDSHIPKHFSPSGHHVAATRDSASQTLVIASQPASNLDSPGRESNRHACANTFLIDPSTSIRTTSSHISSQLIPPSQKTKATDETPFYIRTLSDIDAYSVEAAQRGETSAGLRDFPSMACHDGIEQYGDHEESEVSENVSMTAEHSLTLGGKSSCSSKNAQHLSERRRVVLGEDDIGGEIEYERKQTGPFKGQLVSQGTIVEVNGEDYIEYRVLAKVSLL